MIKLNRQVEALEAVSEKLQEKMEELESEQSDVDNAVDYLREYTD